MLFKTRGIVLSHVKFRESSIIVKIFTEDFGLQSYIVNSVRNSKSGKMAFYQPLTLLDLVVYKNDQKSIQRISEVRCDRAYRNIATNIKKSAIAIFWLELLGRTINSEGMEDRQKFAFIREQLIHLDDMERGYEIMPISFSIELCKYLGFEIGSGLELVNQYGPDNLTENGKLISLFDAIINHENIPPSSKKLRRKALVCVTAYYAHHLDDFRPLKSTEVLQQLFL